MTKLETQGTVNGIIWKAFHECNMVFLGLSFQSEVTVIDTAYFWSFEEFSTASPMILVGALAASWSKMQCLFNPGVL